MTEPLSWDFEGAAQMLGKSFTVDWLKARVKARKIPFGKTGDGDGRAGRVFFTRQHLETILALYSHEAQPTVGAQPITRRRSA